MLNVRGETTRLWIVSAEEKTNDEAVLERNLLLAPKQEKLLNKHEEAILFSELSMFSR